MHQSLLSCATPKLDRSILQQCEKKQQWKSTSPQSMWSKDVTQGTKVTKIWGNFKWSIKWYNYYTKMGSTFFPLMLWTNDILSKTCHFTSLKQHMEIDLNQF